MKSFFTRKSRDTLVEENVSAPSANRTILIVDDSPTEQHVLRSVLMKAGYRVESAENGEQGVSEAKRLHPDLILMDVVMPVLNGFQATRELSSDASTAAIPVIMVTTKDQETDKRWGMRQGARDYLVKPVDAELLIEKIRKIIG